MLIPTDERSSARRTLAIFILAITVLAALVFVYFAETRYQLKPPTGIVLIASTACISIVTAIITRDILFAPLCCFGGMTSGTILAGLMKDWGYASLEASIPIAFAGSIPAFFIALVLTRRQKRLRSAAFESANQPRIMTKSEALSRV